ncbi:MAG: AtpZ/AtpI family protein [Dehalococcoidia bacterium]|nr:AtpZ/AtpI family protein [Dehalococcoidia bacterium]
MPWWAWAFRITGVGWYIATCIVGGIFGGVYLDRWLGTPPLFILLGVLSGTAAAFYGVYRMVEPFLTEPRSGQKQHPGDRPR